MYRCTCLPGYTGTNCQSLIDQCASKPCRNNAICLQYQPNAFRCICPLGFTGELCQDLVDPCTNQKCVKNIPNLSLNVYGLPEMINFANYQECILNTWNYLNPTSWFN